LRDVFLPSLTEVERVILEKQAAEKIQQLGVTLTPQGEISNSHSRLSFSLKKSNYFLLFTEASNQSTQKPHKRRVLLLKRKAVTTGIFDSSKGKDDYSNKGFYGAKLFLTQKFLINFSHLLFSSSSPFNNSNIHSLT
jgi:hypothetical protein